MRLSAVFAVLALVVILLPALGRACQDWLEARVNGAHLAALALEAAGNDMLDPALQDELLTLAGVELVSLRTPGRRLLPLMREGQDLTVGTTIDLRRLSLPRATVLALRLLASRDAAHVRVIGIGMSDPDTVVDLVLARPPLVAALQAAATRIVVAGAIIAAAAAVLLFLALQLLLVRPMRRLTDSIGRFARDPEGPLPETPPGRDDEIGQATAAIADMQAAVRQDLWRKSRLAALGTAMAKVNHDLRGVLATALLISDRLSSSTDAKVRASAPMLLGAIERAVALCTRTMEFVREGPPTLATTRFPLRALVEDAATAAKAAAADEDARVVTKAADDLMLTADRDLLFRVFLNLTRNAIEAGSRTVTVSAAEQDGVVAIDIADDGPGLPATLAEDPFRPFHSGRRGGSGLGLAIARDLVRAHGGEIELAATGPAGTRFRLSLPLVPGVDDSAVEPARAADATP
ncbi:MAG: HAMP domain-containing histidine kinase [Acetobacteraceae bacterium]|nr:HAMP domain-containing histidine kinase [Acetobacteraceae bacterium]